jgi:cytochrome c-type biogenesis protein CcmH/NrfG
MTEITAFCFVLLALTVYVAAPLYARRDGVQTSPHTTDDHAEQRLDEALAELEVDRASGLLDEDGYRAERAALGDARPPLDDRDVD